MTENTPRKRKRNRNRNRSTTPASEAIIDVEPTPAPALSRADRVQAIIELGDLFLHQITGEGFRADQARFKVHEAIMWACSDIPPDE